MSKGFQTCSVCGTHFQLRFAFQAQRSSEAVHYFCSQACHEEHLLSSHQKPCDVCGTKFTLQYAFQRAVVDGVTRNFCTTVCREREMSRVQLRQASMRRIAVLNQKGGTGKTTTSVNLAAGLAESGHRTLLIDLDAQGNVAVSLGIKAQKNLYHVIVDGAHPADCVVNVAENLDAIVSNTSLAKAEVELVNMRDRYKVLRKAMSSITNYEFVIMDCGPSLSVLNQNALVYADNILIPVSCDYLSLVGVKQILQTLKRVNEMLLSPVSILGVVPTFYDMRTRISQESVNTLRAYFKERVLPAIRLNTRLREAPGHKKTIFEFDPDSRGAQDYRRLVKKIIEMCEAENTARQEEAALEQSGA